MQGSFAVEMRAWA